MTVITVLKRKAKGFFKAEDVETISNVVNDVHNIITNASILIRAYYLDWFNSQTKDNLKEPLQINESLVHLATLVVQGTHKLQTRKTKGKQIEILKDEKERQKKIKEQQDKQEALKQNNVHFNNLLRIHKDLFEENYKVDSKYSLSHILAYSESNLVTAYENNIFTNFLRYPKKYIKCDLIAKGFSSKEANRFATIISNFYYYVQTKGFYEADSLMKDTLKTIDPDSYYESLFPPLQEDKEPTPRCYQIKKDPWRYLYHMVAINRDLECLFSSVKETHRRLLNPLPFHSSFIPMHVRLDTSGICQLLMNQDRINELKTLYFLENKKTLNIHSKADLLSSFKKIHGREANSREEDGQWATELWSYVTNLTTCRQWKELCNMVIKKEPMVFDNSIVTDGVSISFQMIDRKSFGRKERFKKKSECSEENEPKAKKDHKKSKMHEATSAFQVDDSAKLLGCDPGKRDILAITDGVTTLRYTKGQRQCDTLVFVQRKETLKRRQKLGVDKFESEELSKFCKKTCYYTGFAEYCKKRLEKEKECKKTYRQRFFREFKFTKYCRVKKSESIVVNRIQQTFCKGTSNQRSLMALSKDMLDNANKESDNLVIGWGNWGKNPNTLKGCCPTPGIGIRRRIECYFQTVTICEHMTSQTCPCCNSVRTLEKMKRATTDYEIHHLLRCKNDDCKSRLWNRNVVGSINILKRFMEENNKVRPSGNEATRVGS